MTGGRDVRVAFVGDSFVAGVGDPSGLGWVGRLVAAAFAIGVPLTAYNLGVRRETSREICQRSSTELSTRLPAEVDARVVLSCGVNDTTWESDGPRLMPAESEANVEVLLAKFRARGWPVLVVGPAPVGDLPQHQRIAELASRFAAAAERQCVPYVDVFGRLRADRNWLEEAAAFDGAHPGSRGYQRLADLILPTWLSWLETSIAAPERHGTPD